MKNVYQVFDDGLQRPARLDEVGFEGCFYLAEDLTKVAAYSDFKRDVLVSKVLERIFHQADPLFDRFPIPEDEGKYMKNTLNRGIHLLSSAYGDDSATTCKILADLRFAATIFQFKCITRRRLPRLPSPSADGDD